MLLDPASDWLNMVTVTCDSCGPRFEYPIGNSGEPSNARPAICRKQLLRIPFTFGPPRDFHDKNILDNLARRQRTSKCQQARIMD